MNARLKVALSALKNKKRPEPSLDAQILDRMGRTIAQMMLLQKMSGHKLGGCASMDSVRVFLEAIPGEYDYEHAWRVRLEQLIIGATMIAKEQHVCFELLLRKMLIVDGWVINAKTLKTPGWMKCFEEIQVKEIEKVFPVIRSVASSM